MDITKLEKLQPKLTKSGKTRSQIGKSSKTKGKTGERYFADKLSEASGKSFIRVPNSGAFVGQSNRDRLLALSRTQCLISLGDIICPEELKHYMIWECKNYKNIAWSKIKKGIIPSLLNKWIGEIKYDIESAIMYIKHKPILGFLCFKITRQGNWIAYNIDINNAIKIISKPIYTVVFNNEEWHIEDFDIFINNNKSELFQCI